MNGNRRKAAVIAILGLVAAGLTIVATATPSSAAPFTERWCSVSVHAPCVISATRNGLAMHQGDPNQIQMITTQNTPDFNYTEFLITDAAGPNQLTTSDTFSVYMDLGTLKPDETEGFAGRPTVKRQTVSASDYRVTYTGHPVLLTQGCDDTTNPISCPDKATSQSLMFQAEIHQLKTDHTFEGFDRSQSADKVNGIFLVSSSTGDYLESDWNNSRLQTDGTTVATAQARFRIPYDMLIRDFKIPNPGTMVASSLVGTVNGLPATYSFSQDPLGGAVFVDISGVTFPPGTARMAAGASHTRAIRIKRGAITPTAPVLKRAKRTSATRAKLTFGAARARGAKIRGYQGRCQAKGHPTLFGTGAYPSLVVKGLKPGRHYLCSVRAQSKAGPGRWSSRAKV